MNASIQSAQATQPVLAPRVLERQLPPPKSLRWPIIVTVLSALLAIGLGLAGAFYLKQQQVKFAAAKSAKADAQARVSNASLEQSGLRDAQPNYDKLRAKGIFIAEARMEFIEVLNSLKEQHQLVQLEYTIEPQRALVLADGRSYPAIDLLASRVNFVAHADHDAELLAFVGAFAQLNRGIFPLQQCRIARSAPPARSRFGAGNEATRNAAAVTSGNGGATANAAALTARCALDWITVRDKLSTSMSPPISPPDGAQK
jgi:hypothetical protein